MYQQNVCRDEPVPQGYLSGQISPEGEDFGTNVIAAMREAIGSNVGILQDAHGRCISERPGLGVDLDVELLEAKSVYRRPAG